MSTAPVKAGLRGRRLVVLVVLAALIMLIDGADVAALPLAVLYIARDWGMPPADFGVALAALNMGFGFGAILIGPLGDRYGRKPLLVWTILAVGLLTAITAWSSDVWHLTLARFFTGVVFGAALTNLNALVAALVPIDYRARLITLISCGIPVGGAVAALLMPEFVAIGGWPGLFLGLGVGIVVLAVALQLWLPTRVDASDEAGAGAASDDGREQAEVRGWRRFAAPLGAEFRLATAVFVGLYTLNALMVSTLAAWLPTLLSMAEFSLDSAARFSSILKIGGLVGGLVLSHFIDRGRPVPSLLASYFTLALTLMAFSVVPPTFAGWGPLLLLVGIGTYGAHMSIMALGTFFYPVRMLATSLGLAVAVARLGAVGGPLLGSLLLKYDVTATGFFLWLLIPIAGCIVFVTLVSRVKLQRGETA